MKLLIASAALALALVSSRAQTNESSPAQLEVLNKKLDDINNKLDAMSQQLLKLEQQSPKPGVMIGEASPGPSGSIPALAAASAGSGNSHVVAKGETLTSIAKQNKVTVEELQRFNHIEDGRKLQAGQTILIPAASASPFPASSASPSASAP